MLGHSRPAITQLWVQHQALEAQGPGERLRGRLVAHPSLLPLGGRTGCHLPGSAGAAKEGISPAGAAGGNVSISWSSLSPRGMAGGKLAWTKQWCKPESVFRQRESVRKPFFLCEGCFFFFLSLLPSIFALSGKLKLLLVTCLHTERCWSTRHHLVQPPLGEPALGHSFKMEVCSASV